MIYHNASNSPTASWLGKQDRLLLFSFLRGPRRRFEAKWRTLRSKKYFDSEELEALFIYLGKGLWWTGTRMIVRSRSNNPVRSWFERWCTGISTDEMSENNSICTQDTSLTCNQNFHLSTPYHQSINQILFHQKCSCIFYLKGSCFL